MDLNGDGHQDILSGSWPGELFFFRGGQGGKFAAPLKLKDKTDKTINIGGGVRNSGNMVLVAGDAKFEKTAKGESVIVYEGRRIEIPEGKSGGITGTASAAHAADWDADGDFDLLVGDIGGNVYLVPNEGTKSKYVFGKHQQLLAGGKKLRVDGDAGPFVADWDGDGDLDLIVGDGEGSVSLFRNVGTRKEPKLAKAKQLVSPGEVTYGPNAPKEPRRGIRSKICVTDFNGDGRLDLLLGDYATQKPNLPKPTPEQKAAQDKARKELKTVQAKWSKLIRKLNGRERLKDKKEREKARREFQEVSRRMQELQAKIPPEFESHGWVWLFLRQGGEKTAGQ